MPGLGLADPLSCEPAAKKLGKFKNQNSSSLMNSCMPGKSKALNLTAINPTHLMNENKENAGGTSNRRS